MGLPRKKNYSGRWDVLIDKSSKCLNRLLEIAARKKRNYIIDQVMVSQSDTLERLVLTQRGVLVFISFSVLRDSKGSALVRMPGKWRHFIILPEILAASEWR